jgi:hypothetical protein
MRPETSPEAAAEGTESVTASEPGTATDVGTPISPAGPSLWSTLTDHVPAPPPASASATEAVAPVPGALRPKESETGVARTSGWSARGRSMTPAPPRGGAAGTLGDSNTGFAVPTSAALTCSGVQFGWRWSSSAAPPATCGEAMLVPENVAQVPGTEERMRTPGAATSGLSRSEIGVGPADEKPASWLGAPEDEVVTAATVIARAELPGEETEPRPNSP